MLATWRVVANMGHIQRLMPFSLMAIILAILLWSPWLILAVVYGFFSQFVVEYLMHRFLYHREPPTRQSPFNALYRIHIGHHEFPIDPEFFSGDDLWFPVRFGLISFALHLVVLWPFLGLGPATVLSAVSIFLGSVSAYVFYEYCHTLAHLNVAKGWFGRRVTQNHLRHHFNDHETAFHVSFGMGWIDRLCGTTYDREDAQLRFDPQTILSMGMDPEDLRLVTARKAFGITRLPRVRSAAGTTSSGV